MIILMRDVQLLSVSTCHRILFSDADTVTVNPLPDNKF